MALQHTARMRKKITAKMLALYEKGYSCEEIARIFHLSRQAVAARLKRNGATMRDNHGRDREPVT